MNPDDIRADASTFSPDLADRLRFLIELDRLKAVERRSFVGGGTRRENSAEHSWHLALFALVLAPAARRPDDGRALDVERVVRMLLVHDVVEIDAGDVFVYDTAAREAKAAEEALAAERIFGLLPGSAGDELRQLWEEYEARTTPESQYAHAVDRLQPLLLNLLAGGQTWSESGITEDRVREVNAGIEVGAPDLWPIVSSLLDAAVASGILSPGPAPRPPD